MAFENEGAVAPATDVAQTPPPAVDTTTPQSPPADNGESGKAAEPSLDDELSSIWQKNNRDRDESGRFKPRESAAEAAPKTEIKDQAQQAAVEKAPPSIDMPQAWSADRKAVWDALPPEARQLVAERESEAHRQITQQGQTISAFEPYVDILEQAGTYGEPIGMQGGEYLQNLINADRMLNNDPLSAIQGIAEAYGIDLSQFGATPPAEGQQGSSPQVIALQNEIAQLRAELNQTSQHVRSREQREAQAQFQSLEGQVAEFSKDKPDFAEIAEDVIGQIHALKRSPATAKLPHNELLQKAYDAARWANPKARDRLLSEQRQAEEKKRSEEAAKRAEDARRSSSINVKSQTVNGQAPTAIDDDLKAIYRRNHS